VAEPWQLALDTIVCSLSLAGSMLLRDQMSLFARCIWCYNMNLVTRLCLRHDRYIAPGATQYHQSIVMSKDLEGFQPCAISQHCLHANDPLSCVTSHAKQVSAGAYNDAQEPGLIINIAVRGFDEQTALKIAAAVRIS
jgi:hypothetical protein